MASFTSNGLKMSLLDRVVVRLRLQDLAGQKELFGQLLIPLLAQIGRHDNQNPPLPFGPSL